MLAQDIIQNQEEKENKTENDLITEFV